MDVAVITPAYNRCGNRERSLLEKTIYSVRWQTYGKHIHLIVDDGSTDRTKELVEFHAREDPRIIYARRNKPKGEKLTASNAINFGFDMLMNESRIKYFTVLHSDDLIAEKSVEERAEELKSGRCGLVFGNQYSIDDIYRIINEVRDFEFSDKKRLYEITKISRRFPHTTLMFSKDMLKEVGFYDERVGFGEDCDMSLRLIKAAIESGSDIEYIDKFLAYYMLHDDSITGLYKKHGWDKNDMKFVDIKNSESMLDYYMKLAKRFIRKPHSYLPESVKKVLRPVRDRFLRNGKSPYRDEFLEKISKARSDFWETKESPRRICTAS